MPEVTLIHYTGKGHPDPMYAAKLLALSKSTRLQLTPDDVAAFFAKPDAEIIETIAYMANTIPSSWEMVDVMFSVNKVSRATAQQVTRTRNASFAMQAQRVTDMSEVTWDVPPSVAVLAGGADAFNADMRAAINNYIEAVGKGIPLEDARDLLPMGVHSNLIAKYNLRSFVELIMKRDSLRVQGPYLSIARQMKESVLAVWPWAAPFFVPANERAIDMLKEVALELGSSGAISKGPVGQIAKAMDLIK